MKRPAISFESALSKTLNAARGLPTEVVSFAHAIHRILAVDVTSDTDRYYGIVIVPEGVTRLEKGTVVHVRCL